MADGPRGGEQDKDLDNFDFIIVGAGSAGCVLAERLSADPRNRVLLLEAGGSDRRFWIRTPIGYGMAYYDPAINWKYQSEPDAGLGGRSAYWPRGKVLGGSSSINAMVYCRGLPADYDDWQAAGNPGWGWHDVEPVFRSNERRVAANGSVQGEGPLWVSDREPEYHPVKQYFLDAAREIGLPATSDVNGGTPEGVGAYPVTTRRGLRCSAADAFLRPAMRRPNLVVRTGVLVRRLIIEGRRATGVEYQAGRHVLRVAARGEVLLSAGAVNSPQLLQLSGVGPADLLRRHGIAVVHDNPAVGGGLRDHLGISYFYRASQPTLNGVLGSWSGRIGAALQFMLRRTGPLSLSVNQMGGLVRSDAALTRPDIQLYFSPISYTTEFAGKRPLLRPDPYPGFILGFNACRTSSTGRIDIASGDPSAPPRIMPNYLSTAQDVREAIAGARLIGRLQSTRALRALIAGQPAFDPAAASDAAIVQDFRARAGTVYHPCGTCAMLPESAGGVVDAELRVYGIQGLRVVDASVFPSIPSANTNAPAMMVARKAANLISLSQPESVHA